MDEKRRKEWEGEWQKDSWNELPTELSPKNEGNAMSLFPTPVVITNIGRDFTENELQLLLTDLPMYKDEQGTEGDDGMTLSMTNHRSKDPYLFDNFTEELKDIKKFIEYQLIRYLENIEGIDINLATLRITQAWLNNTKSQEKHHLHFHLNSYLSGVLYIKCLPNDNIIFKNRLHGIHNNMQFVIKKVTVWNAMNIEQSVKEGDLVIFPSWVPHSVNVNETENMERITLSFNTFPVGEMGDYYGSHLKL